MRAREFNITGIPAGDGECWCLLVTKETFEQIRREAPEDYDEFKKPSEKNPEYRYMIYPSELILEKKPFAMMEDRTPVNISIRSWHE